MFATSPPKRPPHLRPNERRRLDLTVDTCPAGVDYNGGMRYPLTIDPTPEELAAMCVEIQATWSESERQRRTEPAYQPQHWTAPVIHGVEIESLAS